MGTSALTEVPTLMVLTILVTPLGFKPKTFRTGI